MQNPGGFYPRQDLGISLSYQRRYDLAIRNSADQAVAVLTEFLREHPFEFSSADWVPEAAGRIMLGLPMCTKQDRKRARQFFEAYWTAAFSPKLDKIENLVLARNFYDSPHREHWTAAVRWMRKQRHWPTVDPDFIIKEFSAKHPKKCDCLPNSRLEKLCNVAQRNENLSPGKVVLKTVAKLNRVSARSLSSYWPGVEKPLGNSQP